LEVAGIARAIARALRLNEDLVEAIALGHDLGHTPVGHAGESVIDEILRAVGGGGFAHNEQSVRVVEVLENDGQGLNLTWEVRDGIRNHSGGCTPATLEGKVVHLADRIAYVNHDIDDALRAGMLTYADLPPTPLEILGATGSERIDTLVHDVVDSSFDTGDILQSPAVALALEELRNFLFENVYPRALEEAGGDKIRLLITQLMEYFLDHPESLPQSVFVNEADASGVPPLVRAVTDYVAGMTDRYAQRVYLELFMPKCWGNL